MTENERLAGFPVCEWRRPDGTVLARWQSPAVYQPGPDPIFGPIEFWEGDRLVAYRDADGEWHKGATP